MLHHHPHLVGALLLVLVDHVDGFRIVGHRLFRHQGTVLGQHNGREQVLDLLFYLVDIHVANNDEALIVRTVPLLIVRLQERTLEVVDDLHQSDRHAVAVFRAWVELWEVALQHTHLGRSAQAPLLVDHATLLLYLLLLQQQTVGPVIEDEQTRVDNTLARRGYITNIIYRLVDAGIGVQVTTELDTHTLTPAQQIVALEVLRTVEGHVLQEVGQSSLVVVLLDGAHTLGNVKLSPLLGPIVVTDVISQSVVEFADTYIGIDGNCRHFLCQQRNTTGQHQQEAKKKFFHLHKFGY